MGILPAHPAGGMPCSIRPLRLSVSSSLRLFPRAFTLIELLVVVAVIAVLIGLLIPTLSNARRAAQSGQSSQRLRDAALAIRSSVTDNDDRFRMPKILRDYYGNYVVNPGFGGIQAGVRRTWVDPDDFEAAPWSLMYWFSTSTSWPVLLRAYFGYEPNKGVLAPNSRGNFAISSDYVLTHTVMADPAYFTDNLMVQVQGLDLCRGQLFSHVRSPSGKVVMLERPETAAERMGQNPLPAHDDPITLYVVEGAELVVRPMAFFDGHIEIRRTKDAAPSVQNSLYGRPWNDLMQDGCLTTKGGIRARDF